MKKIIQILLFLTMSFGAFAIALEIPDAEEFPEIFSADDFEPPMKEIVDLSSQDQEPVGDFKLIEDPNEKTQDGKDLMVSTEPMIICSPKSDSVAFKNRCEFYNNFPDAADLCTPEEEQELRKTQAKPGYDDFGASQ